MESQRSAEDLDPVYIIWDIEDVAIPERTSPSMVVKSILLLAEYFGQVQSFKCICKEGKIPSKTKRELQESGVVFEEIFSEKSEAADISIVTALLSLLSERQKEAGFCGELESPETSNRQRRRLIPATLVLISGDRDFAPGLRVLRRSGFFAEILLLHHTNSVDGLKNAATRAIEFSTFLGNCQAILKSRGSLPLESELEVTRGRSVTYPPATVPTNSQIPHSTSENRRSSAPDIGTLLHADDHSAPRVSSDEFNDSSEYDPSDNVDTDFDEYGFPRDSPNPPACQDVPSESEPAGVTGAGLSYSSVASTGAGAGAGASAGSAVANVARPAGHGGSLPPINPPSASELKDMKRKNSDLEVALLLLDKVMNYCKDEKIIPREAVVRRRAESHLKMKVKLRMKPRRPTPRPRGLQVPLFFEEWLQMVHDARMCYVLGTSPHRLIWPLSGKFDCADYFRPVERLSYDDATLLLQFLERRQPEVNHGRYGFANFLQEKGPDRIRSQPHGYLIELVQLLLNKHILSFDKGTITYSPLPSRTRSAMAQSFCVNSDKTNTPNPGVFSSHAFPALNTPQAQTVSRCGDDDDKDFEGPDHVAMLAEKCMQLHNFLGGKASVTATVTDMPTAIPEGSKALVHSATIVPKESPVYHFERAGAPHQPRWVCVVTLPIFTRDESKDKDKEKEKDKDGKKKESKPKPTGSASKLQTKAAPNPTPKPVKEETAPKPKFKRFKSTVKSKKMEAKQEAALRALESSYWALAFNEPSPAEDAVLSIGHSVTFNEVVEDQVVVLDILLAQIGQHPMVYNLESNLTRSGSRTLWRCKAELHLRARIEFDANRKDGVSGCSSMTSSPALSSNPEETPPSSPENTSDPSKPNKPPRMTSSRAIGPDTLRVRYPSIKVSTSQARKYDAKCIVASHVLRLLEKAKKKYPKLFEAPIVVPATSISSLSLPGPVQRPRTTDVKSPRVASMWVKAPSLLTANSAPASSNVSSATSSPRDTPISTPRSIKSHLFSAVSHDSSKSTSLSSSPLPKLDAFQTKASTRELPLSTAFNALPLPSTFNPAGPLALNSDGDLQRRFPNQNPPAAGTGGAGEQVGSFGFARSIEALGDRSRTRLHSNFDRDSISQPRNSLFRRGQERNLIPPVQEFRQHSNSPLRSPTRTGDRWDQGLNFGSISAMPAPYDPWHGGPGLRSGIPDVARTHNSDRDRYLSEEFSENQGAPYDLDGLDLDFEIDGDKDEKDELETGNLRGIEDDDDGLLGPLPPLSGLPFLAEKPVAQSQGPEVSPAGSQHPEADGKSGKKDKQ